jgi:hypothetical protein
MKKYFLYVIGFIVLTLVEYYIYSYIDYSYKYFMVIRLATIGIGYFYFLLAARCFSKNMAIPLFVIIITMVYNVLLLFIFEHINSALLEFKNKETVAVIKDCEKSRGTAYCVYSYRDKNKYYEIRFCNEGSILKYKNNDRVMIRYYTLNPAISEIKKHSD